MNTPDEQPEDLVDQVEEVLDEATEEVEDLGHAMDDAVEDFAEDNPTAYRLFMWVFTLVLLMVVAWLCYRYYGGISKVTP